MCVCAAKNSDFALANDAVVIDLSDLNTVTVDVEGKVCPNYYGVNVLFGKKKNLTFNQRFLFSHPNCMYRYNSQ